MIIKNELTSFRRCKSLVVLLIVFFTFSPQVSRAQHLTSAERDWLTKKGTIIFVSQSDYPPFEFVDKDHDLTGMCIDLVRWIATEYGFKVKFYDMPFLEAQEAVLSGKADVITSLFYSQARKKKFDFTDKTWEVPALIFVKSERPDIIGLKDLVGKRIAMQRGDYAEEFLRSKGIEFKLIPTASFAQAVDAVVAGQADAVIGDQQVVLYHLFTHNLIKQIKSVGTPLYDGQNCMGVRAGATQLQALLCKGIQLARECGIFSSINRKWVGTSYQQNPSYKRYFYYILISILGIIILLLIILAWNIALRRTVARKTKFLEQSEAQFAAAQKIAGFGHWEFDNISGSLHWSKQVYNIFELSNEYPLSLESFLDRIHPEDRELVASSFMDHLKKNKPFDIQHRIVTDNSGEKWVREVCHTEYDDRGSALVTLGTVHDITTQYQQFDFYRSIWDSLPHSIYIVSQDYEIQFINKAMIKNFGPVNGRKCYEYLFHQTSVCTCCNNAQVFAGEVIHDDFYYEEYDKYFDLYYMPVTNPDGTISKLEIAIDVTKLKKDEIEAQAANQAKSVFLSNMSHELRTPLNAIIGYAQLLAQDSSLTASQQRGIRTIHQSGEHLLLLINDILDLSKFDAHKMGLVYTRVWLPEFFQNVVAIINIRARKKGVDFFYEPEAGLPVVVEADELRLRQILLNLLSNAVKFTQQGFCRLMVKSRPVENNRVCLEIVVEDSGVGILPEQAEQVFEPFYQVGKPLQFIEGSGLGLTISRELVELMGGELQLESPIDLQPEVGGGPGSRISFTIEVPILEADPTLYTIPPHIASCTFTATQKSPPKIMIVDDNLSNREVLRDTLIQFGFLAREVVDGSKVLATCRNFRPDVILMDLRMPELDGFAATKQLKKEPGIVEIPVVAITACTSDMESLKRKCLENGFCDFIVKPWSVTVLLETLAKLLHIRLQYSFDESISDKPHGIIVPPSQILENLQKQVASGDINGLEKSSAEILKMESGKYRIFAQHIASLVEDCQLIEVGKFITACEES